MARSDLLLSLAKAGSQGDTTVFKRTLEAIIAEVEAELAEIRVRYHARQAELKEAVDNDIP